MADDENISAKALHGRWFNHCEDRVKEKAC